MVAIWVQMIPLHDVKSHNLDLQRDTTNRINWQIWQQGDQRRIPITETGVEHLNNIPEDKDEVILCEKYLYFIRLTVFPAFSLNEFNCFK